MESRSNLKLFQQQSGFRWWMDKCRTSGSKMWTVSALRGPDSENSVGSQRDKLIQTVNISICWTQREQIVQITVSQERHLTVTTAELARRISAAFYEEAGQLAVQDESSNWATAAVIKATAVHFPPQCFRVVLLLAPMLQRQVDLFLFSSVLKNHKNKVEFIQSLVCDKQVASRRCHQYMNVCVNTDLCSKTL